MLNFDGSLLAYDAKDKNRLVVVVNGSEQRYYDGSYGPAFSDNGRHFIYVAWREGRQYLIFDGKELGPYHEIAELSIEFSHSGSSISFVVINDTNQQIVVVDGKGGKPYDEVLRHPPPPIWGVTPAFSESGSHFAYVADGEDYQVIVADGRESKQYELVIPRDIDSCPRTASFSGTLRLHEMIVRRHTNSCRFSSFEHIFAYRGGELFLIEVQLPSP